MAKPKLCMYGMKIAGMDHVSYGPVPVHMVVKIIWSTVIQVHFRPDFIKQGNTMNPDQTAPNGSSHWEQSDLGPYCFQ